MVTVKELQKMLGERGVCTSNMRRAELQDLVKLAIDMNIEIDPDGVMEDREEVINQKLTIENGMILCNPVLLKSTSKDITLLPLVTEYDVLKYLEKFACFDEAALRDFKSMPGYTLQMDGYVSDVTVGLFPIPRYISVISKVKPSLGLGNLNIVTPS